LYFNRFKQIKEIGRGAEGVVYAVEDISEKQATKKM